VQAIRIGVVRSRSYGSPDGFHVYGDGGSGQMDWDHPVTPRRQLLWGDVPGVVGHVEVGHLTGLHLDNVLPDGHAEGTHLLDEHLLPAAAVEHETEPFVFGRFRHAVVMEDAAGNATLDGVTAHETVVNSEPAPARGFRPKYHEVVPDRFTFSFSRSDRLTG
jgi:hypothetical protein